MDSAVINNSLAVIGSGAAVSVVTTVTIAFAVWIWNKCHLRREIAAAREVVEKCEVRIASFFIEESRTESSEFLSKSYASHDSHLESMQNTLTHSLLHLSPKDRLFLADSIGFQRRLMNKMQVAGRYPDLFVYMNLFAKYESINWLGYSRKHKWLDDYTDPDKSAVTIVAIGENESLLAIK